MPLGCRRCAKGPLPDSRHAGPQDSLAFEEELGHGSFGAVVAARHPSLGRLAVKDVLPLPALAKRAPSAAVNEHLQMVHTRALMWGSLAAEVEASLALSHEGIVRVCPTLNPALNPAPLEV